MPLSQFRLVTMEWMEPSSWNDVQQNIVHESEVDTFLKATLELHYAPGLNPHNGNKCRIAREITVASFDAAGPFWWTTPGLKDNGDPSGATLLQSDGRSRRLWINPDYLAQLRANERAMLEEGLEG